MFTCVLHSNMKFMSVLGAVSHFIGVRNPATVSFT